METDLDRQQTKRNATKALGAATWYPGINIGATPGAMNIQSATYTGIERGEYVLREMCA